MNIEITEESKKVFLMYAKDVNNWGNEVPVGGNVGGTKEERGNLTQLKKAGLITTTICNEPDCHKTWIAFTEKGKEFAKENGVNLDWIIN